MLLSACRPAGGYPGAASPVAAAHRLVPAEAAVNRTARQRVWPVGRRGSQPEVGPGRRHGHPAAGRAHEQALADEERLVHVLDRFGRLSHADGQRGQAHRTAAEAFAQRAEERPVHLVEAPLVDTEHGQPVVGRLLVDDARATNLGEVAHPTQQTIGDPRRAPRPAGDLVSALPARCSRRGCRRPAARWPADRPARSSRAGRRVRTGRATAR